MTTHPPALHQDDITVKGRVAVWTGSFTDEIAADDYLNLDRGFERDFGFRIADWRGPELAVTPQPVSIRDLGEGFSCWRGYSEAVIVAANAAGITTASTMLVFHWMQFDLPPVCINPQAPMRFPGNFNFEGFPEFGCHALQKGMQATARMASLISSVPSTRQHLIEEGRPPYDLLDETPTSPHWLHALRIIRQVTR